MENQLFYDKKTGWERMTEADDAAMMAYAEGYKAFLDEAKTERDAVRWIKAQAEAKGYREYVRGMAVKAGDRFYKVNRNKGIVLFVIGKNGLKQGINLTAAHMDSPRIDIRTIPLYEDNGMALFKTHYYGGIKKYQWPTIPLELRGVVCRVTENGVETVNVRIGDKPGDPLFVITDVLIHLATDQMQKPLHKGIAAEDMNVLVGSRPSKSETETSDRIKLWVMEYLNAQYGITEEDFLSAELACVPAFKACDIGFDRSFVGGYGHDDRVCSYPALTALFDTDYVPEKTAMTILVDRKKSVRWALPACSRSSLIRWSLTCAVQMMCCMRNASKRPCACPQMYAMHLTRTMLLFLKSAMMPVQTAVSLLSSIPARAASPVLRMQRQSLWQRCVMHSTRTMSSGRPVS